MAFTFAMNFGELVPAADMLAFHWSHLVAPSISWVCHFQQHIHMTCYVWWAKGAKVLAFQFWKFLLQLHSFKIVAVNLTYKALYNFKMLLLLGLTRYFVNLEAIAPSTWATYSLWINWGFVSAWYLKSCWVHDESLISFVDPKIFFLIRCRNTEIDSFPR